MLSSFDAYYKWRKTCEVSINCKQIIKDFDVIWENSFHCQKDSSSCGVFVLMYMSYKLGLLTYDPASERISKIRNLMALELFIGKLTTKRYEEHKQDNIKICFCATSHKQQIAKEVTLYCKIVPSMGNKSKWTLGGTTVSNQRIYKFRLTERNIETYFCYVGTYFCFCSVMARSVSVVPTRDRNFMLDELKIAMTALCN